MGFFSKIKKIFGSSQDEPKAPEKEQTAAVQAAEEGPSESQPVDAAAGAVTGEPAPASTDGAEETPEQAPEEAAEEGPEEARGEAPLAAPVAELRETPEQASGGVAEEASERAPEASPGDVPVDAGAPAQTAEEQEHVGEDVSRAEPGASVESIEPIEVVKVVEVVETVESVASEETADETAEEADGETVAEPAAEAGAESGVEPAVESVVETQAVSEAAPEASREDTFESASEAASEPEPEVQPAPDPEPEPRQEPEQKPAAEPAAEEEPVIIDLLEMVTEDEEEEQVAAPEASAAPEAPETPVNAKGSAGTGRLSGPVYQELTRRLREAEARLSVWLDIVLDGVTEAGEELNDRVLFLLRTLEAPENEAQAFVDDFAGWLDRMDYRQLDEFRSELQYRLSLALELEDEEDERSRLLVKLTDSLAKTREQFVRRFESLISRHGELDDDFWEELEEIFIMADLGVEASLELIERLKERARAEKATTSEQARELLRQEIRSIFTRPRHIVGIEPPEVVLMIGVNGAGKTTTIAKLAYRDRMQGKKVMIAAADTFRAAAIEQLQVWADRVGCLFHAKQAGSDPASVAFEAMDRAMSEGVDVLYVDTAGRLQTKVNLMDELAKIRNVIAKKHPGAPHRTVLVLDATTGQNALSQAKLFKESAGVDELILTKLDGTAKGGVAIAVAMQHKLPITFVGIGEKMEDLRPFNGDDYADALLKL